MLIAITFVFIHCLLMLGQYVIDGRRIDLFNPKNLFQIYLIFQLPFVLFLGVNFEVPGFVALSTATSIEEILKLGSIFLLAHFAFLISYYSAGRVGIKPIFLIKTRWHYPRTKLLCALVFGFGYIMAFYLFEINGGYINFVDNRENWRAGAMAGQGWIFFPATAMLGMAASALVIASSKMYSQKNGLIKLLILCVITILPASQLGFRGLMLLPLLQILFTYHFRVHTLKISRVIPLLFGLVALFTLYGIYRESYHLMDDGLDPAASLQFLTERPEFLFSIFLRSKGADVVAFFIRQIDDSRDFAYFIPALFESITIFVPSAWWADKPVSQGVIFSQKYFGTGGGVSPTVVGEAYWQAGILGVLIVMMTLGLIFRVYVNSIRRYSNNDSLVFLCGAIFPSLVMMPEAVQGYLNGIVLITITSLILIFLFSINVNHHGSRNSYPSSR